MRDEIYQIFQAHNIVLKNLRWIDVSEFSKKRTLKFAVGVDLKGFYTMVVLRFAKARFLIKELEDIRQIYEQIEINLDTKIKKSIILYNSEICSKTQKALKDMGWKYDTL